MPDPVTGTVAALGGGSLISGVIQGRSAKRAARAQERAAQQAADVQREALESFERRTQPFAEAGGAAINPLLNLLGISPTGEAVQPQTIAEINPLVDFLRQEGFEDIQESAAARGALGSGGTLRDLTRFNTQLASTIAPQLQQQRFGQLFNLVGLGSNAAAGQGTAGLQTAGNIGNLLQSGGAARAGGILGQGQAITNTIGDIAGIAGGFQGGLFGQPGGAPVGGFNFLNRPQQVSTPGFGQTIRPF